MRGRERGREREPREHGQNGRFLQDSGAVGRGGSEAPGLEVYGKEYGGKS